MKRRSFLKGAAATTAALGIGQPTNPASGKTFSEVGTKAQPTMITDLTTVTTPEVLFPDPKAGHWRICTYSCDGMQGKLLYTDDRSNAPELKLPLGLDGWHRVCVGLFGFSEGGRYGAGGNRLRLSGDRSLRPLVRETKPLEGMSLGESFEEAVLTCANLTGQDLVIAPPAPGSGAKTGLAYVRCEPLSPEEIQQIEKDRGSSECRRIIAYNDGLSFYDKRTRWEKEDFWEMIAAYKDSDVDSLYYGLVGHVTVFPAQHGEMRSGLGAEQFESLKARGINPVVTAMEYAQEIGLKFFVYQRMGAWADPFPGDYWTSNFTTDHPEFCCVNRDGIPFSRLSYAYPEVRRHQLNLLSEVASYGADGIDLNFMRGPVYVAYEEPMVRGFKKKYGEDPRRLDEWDQRWLQYQSWPMTEFLKELRQELDQVGKKLGKRLQISAVTLPTSLGNLFYGLDLQTWVEQGLVDRLVPWGFVRGMPVVDLKYYRELTEGTSTTFWPHLSITGDGSGRNFTAYRKEALEYYDAGAQGLAMWDLLKYDSMSVKGPFLRSMGHIDQLRDAVKQTEQDEKPVIKGLDRLGDIDLRVWSAPATHRERLIPGDYPKHMVWWPS